MENSSNNPLYTQLLERVISERPDMAPYADLFQQLLVNTEENPATPDRAQEMELRLRKMTSVAKRLKADLNGALDELESFAKALGACEICWGEDRRCRNCYGKGQPGFVKTDEAQFNRLILPALREIPWIEIKDK